MDRMREGEQGKVLWIAENSALRERLQDLGLIEGTNVRCVMRSPSGGPAAYEIRGAVIALRSGDASTVLVGLEQP